MKTKLFNWIGGKKWLAKELNATFSLYKNKNIDTYIEPFGGGLGSFFFTLDTLKEINIKKVYINDINNTIITTYRLIKEDYMSIFNLYAKIEEEYIKTIPAGAYGLHKTKDKEMLKPLLKDSQAYYNDIKSKFNLCKNDNSLESISLFLFLAQHCFNGVYRENGKGEFNTPFNWETAIPNLDNKLNLLKSYSDIFNDLDIEFHNLDCFEFLNNLLEKEKTSLVYCDPPYLNLGIGENKYNKDHFGKDEQYKLLEFYKTYSNVVFSNHFHDVFEDFCNENGFTLKKCYRTNIMSARNDKRGNKVSEILAHKI